MAANETSKGSSASAGSGKPAGNTTGKTTDNTTDNTTGKTTGKSGDMPQVDFSTFVLSLGTAALYQLGAVADPETGETAEADPLVAKQTIDTLEMLRDKTRGNLDEEERNLIDSLLYELRMRFVEVGR